MTIQLRPYQVESVDSVFDYWTEIGGNPLVVLPTGTGKSLTIAALMRRLFDDYGDMRIVCASHVAEILDQDAEAVLRYWPWADVGIYSAGLGRRQLHNKILFAGIQSIWNKVARLGPVDLLVVDEAHSIPRKAASMWGKFLKALREANPDMRMIGFTATEFRLDSGYLHEDEGAMFDDIAYKFGLREAIDDGYLKPLVSKATQTTLSTIGVAKRGGEYVAGELQAAVDKAELNRAIIDETVQYGGGRRSWMVFATGVEHAQHLAEEVRSRGIRAEVVTGDTPSGERKRIIADFKAYRLRCVVNCGVLTTGFDHPGVDMIVAARPTESAGLLVQIAGRGTRPVYASGMPLESREERLAAIAAGPAKNCLFLDFGGLIRRHGPIDLIKPRKPGKGGGDAPVKTCPECFELVHASVMTCPQCDHQWERQLSSKITKQAANTPILSKSEPTWRKVGSRKFSRHEKFGGNASVKVEYVCPRDGDGSTMGNLGIANHFPEWVPFESPTGRFVAEKWWREHRGAEPVPATVTEALERTTELRAVDEIRIEASGKYWRVTAKRFGGDAVSEVVAAPVGNLGLGRLVA